MSTGFSRTFTWDTEHSRVASEILGRAEDAVHAARVAALALAGLEFASGQTTVDHVRRLGEGKALCGRLVVRVTDRTLMSCRACEQSALRILGVWIFGEQRRRR
jgi:hypothetical protein